MRKKSKSKTLTADWVWGGVFGVLLSIMVLTIIFFGDIGVVSERSNINADSIYTKRSSLVTVVRKQQAIALRPEVHQDFFQINERLSSNVETEMRLISDIGTGFVLGEYIITNRHVAGEPSEYAVIDYRGRHFEVIDVYLDLDHDIAILRVDNLDLPSLRLADESSLRVGERIVSLGVNPNEDYPRSKVGEVLGLNRSITATNIFGDRVETLTNLMTMSVIIEPGSSGGPVLNEQGLVVGVNVATAADRETSFAVDADALRSVINFFEATGGFDRPFLGLLYRVILIDDGENQSYSHGSEIIEILSGSSVAQSDLQVDDVIVAINGEPLENGDLMRGMRSYKIGNTISLTFLRDGALMSIQLELAGR